MIWDKKQSAEQHVTGSPCKRNIVCYYNSISNLDSLNGGRSSNVSDVSCCQDGLSRRIRRIGRGKYSDRNRLSYDGRDGRSCAPGYGSNDSIGTGDNVLSVLLDRSSSGSGNGVYLCRGFGRYLEQGGAKGSSFLNAEEADNIFDDLTSWEWIGAANFVREGQ